mgnify:CR=1 FL=1
MQNTYADGREKFGSEARSQSSDRRLSKFFFLTAAGLSLVVSIAIFLGGDREQGIFIGLWVPSILSLGHFLTEGVGNE